MTAERVSDGGWAVAMALAVLGAGIGTGSPLLVALAIVPLGFVAAEGFDAAPEPTVAVEREFAGVGSESNDDGGLSGDPGERVTVRLTVQNTGSEPLVDLRIVDGVPVDVPVVEGTPRRCLTLDSDETEVLEYDVELRRGEHRFGDATVRSRGAGGSEHWTETVAVAGQHRLTCFPYVEEVPIESGANDYAGEIPTDEGGSGVEFYSVRDYEPGDPIRSIDWRRYANNRELATIEFRAERATRVVCLVDRRRSQERAQPVGHLPALDLSVAAARRTFDAVIDAGYPTGVIGINDRLQLVVEPGAGEEARTRGNDLFDAILSRERDVGEFAQTRWGNPSSLLPSLLPGEAQVVLFSSFVDDTPVSLLEQLRIHGYPVCVVSPDVASGREDTPGRLSAIQRRTRLADARRTGARVVDWDVGKPIGLVLNEVVTEVSSR